MFHVIVSEKVILKYELQTYLSSFIFLIFSAGQNKPVPVYDVKSYRYNVYVQRVSRVEWLWTDLLYAFISVCHLYTR